MDPKYRLDEVVGISEAYSLLGNMNTCMNILPALNEESRSKLINWLNSNLPLALEAYKEIPEEVKGAMPTMPEEKVNGLRERFYQILESLPTPTIL